MKALSAVCASLAAAAACATLEAPAYSQDNAALAAAALQVLTNNCASCHGPGSISEGGINFITDLGKLAESGLVIPHNAAGSPVIQRVQATDPAVRMPLGGTPLSAADVQALAAWIAAGAPSPTAPVPPQVGAFVSDQQMLQAIADDLGRVADASLPYIRYVTLTHLANSGAADDLLQRYRNAVSQIFNSLSWQPTIAAPALVDVGRTIARIDLRNYGWSPATWDSVTRGYPYDAGDVAAYGAALAARMATAVPVIRGDWLLATATKPPLYYDVLGLPTQEAALEARLGVDFPAAFAAARPGRPALARAGFQDSGVSNFNRVIDRVPTAYGSFWRSYDFGSSGGTRYVFSNPFGPAPTFGGISQTGEQLGFTPDGGEVIFSLPNGLQAYMLINASGSRLDVGPAAIVFDRERGRPILPGISCMSCHQHGMVTKADELGTFVAAAPVFSTYAKQLAERIFPGQDTLNALYSEDSARFSAAMAAASVDGATSGGDLVALADLYDAPVDLAHGAAELGLPSTAAAAARLSALSADSQRPIAPLLAGLTIPRDTFEQAFAAVAAGLAATAGARTLAMTYPDLRIDMPAAASTAYQVPVPNSGIVDQVAVDVAAEDPGPCALALTLIAPSGAAVTLKAVTAQADCAPDLQASFTADNSPLGHMQGESLEGAWMLQMVDSRPPGTPPGALRKLRLVFLYH